MVEYKDLDKICRVCLKSGDLHFRSVLYAFYKNLIEIPEDEESEHLPRSVCLKCKIYLEDIATFIDKSKDSEATLKKLYLKIKRKQNGRFTSKFVNNEKICKESLQDESDVMECELIENSVIENGNKSEYDLQNAHFDYSEIITVQIIDEHDGINDVEKEKKKNSHLSYFQPVTCNDCNQCFFDAINFVKHLIAHHDDELNNFKSGTVKQFKCKICDKLFTSYATLKTHYKRHMDVKAFHCNICEKSFVTPYELAQHSSIHFNKTHKCNICNKYFKDKNVFYEHSVKHIEKVKTYDCLRCDQTFATTSEVKRHTLTHLSDRNLKCDKCGKIFLSKFTLLKHQLLHKRNNVYKKCDKYEKIQ